MKQAGLDLAKDVQAVPLGFADHVAAFERGDVDAFMGSEPPASVAVSGGKGVYIPEVEKTRLGDFNTANWASAKVLAERPDVVKAVCRMQKDAAEFLSPGGVNDEVSWKELLVTQFGFDEKVYAAVLPRIGARWQFDAAREAQVKGAVAMLKEQGAIPTEPDVEQLFAREYWDV
jgi:NitT/TauT family transport system substrate-binding protein